MVDQVCRICCGCSSCAQVCPQEAINMEADEKGFLYPKINKEKCTFCGKCQEACPLFHDLSTEQFDNQMVYAVQHKDSQVLSNSSSGGMFTALSDYVLEQGGTVFGAVIDAHGVIIHAEASTKKERDKMRGAKYVQSKITNTFSMVAERLRQEKVVLFSGTPCQCAGLRYYISHLGISDRNLIVVDILCKGVPSPKLFHDYLEHLKLSDDSSVRDISFRTKQDGWKKSQKMMVCFSDYCYENERKNDAFYRLFMSNLALRPSCFSCRYVGRRRESDISIGDFWGIKDFDLEDKGTSLVLINSIKGKECFEKIKHVLTIKKESFENASKKNITLIRPSKKPEALELFWKIYLEKGIQGTLEFEAKDLW